MKPKRVSVDLSWPVQCYLRELIATGLFGATVEEAAMTLILDGLKNLVGTKLLRPKTFD